MSCDCGGCSECLRDQGRWGTVCVFCGQWVDFDRQGSAWDGEAHTWCEQAYEDLCTGKDVDTPPSP